MSLLQFQKDNLAVEVYETRAEMGQAAADDIAAVLGRLLKEKENALQQIARIEGKLSNEGFVAKAPAAVVNAEREKLEKFRTVVAKLDDSLAALQ